MLKIKLKELINDYNLKSYSEYENFDNYYIMRILINAPDTLSITYSTADKYELINDSNTHMLTIRSSKPITFDKIIKYIIGSTEYYCESDGSINIINNDIKNFYNIVKLNNSKYLIRFNNFEIFEGYFPCKEADFSKSHVKYSDALKNIINDIVSIEYKKYIESSEIMCDELDNINLSYTFWVNNNLSVYDDVGIKLDSQCLDAKYHEKLFKKAAEFIINQDTEAFSYFGSNIYLIIVYINPKVIFSESPKLFEESFNDILSTLYIKCNEQFNKMLEKYFDKDTVAVIELLLKNIKGTA